MMINIWIYFYDEYLMITSDVSLRNIWLISTKEKKKVKKKKKKDKKWEKEIIENIGVIIIK